MRTGDLFRDIPADHSDEHFEDLVTGNGVRIERIVSNGQSTPEGTWYDQDWDEWVVVLAGAAVIEVEGDNEPYHMTPGQWMFLPARCRHRVAWTCPDEATIWAAVHFNASS